MRTVFRFTQSYWLHVLMLALTVHAYSRTAYLQGWVTGRRGFSDIAAPLYASSEWWIQEAIDADRLRDAVKEHLPRVIPALAVALAWSGLVVWQVRARRPLPSYVLVPAAVLFVIAMNVTTSMIDAGTSSLTSPFRRYHLEYYGDIVVVGDDPARFVRSYPELGYQICHHARTHPPGAVLFLWLAGKLFGEGVMTASLAAIAVSSLTVIPAYASARDRGGPRAGLIAAGLYVVTPSLVLFGATCMDGVFALFPVTAMWLMNRALRRDDQNPQRHSIRPTAKSLTYTLAAGLAFSASLFFTFAVAALGVIYATLLLSQLFFGIRAFMRTLLLFLVVLAVIVLAHGLLSWTVGYDPIACLKSAIASDSDAVGRLRSRPIDVGFANLVAFIIGVGVVSIVGWWHHIARQFLRMIYRHSDDAWDLAVLVGIVVTAFLGWFTLETERIWLFLVPPLLAGAAAGFDARGRSVVHTLALVFVLLILLFQTLAAEFVLNTWW